MDIIIAKGNKLKKLVKEVNKDKVPIIITSDTGESAVLISMEDFESLQETIYLLSSKANAKWLNESIEEYQKGKLKTLSIEDIEKSIEE